MSDDFDLFVIDAGERLRRVLVAHYGVDVGNDVTADALAYAWEHWSRVQAMDNPVGYLYRVAQSASRRHRRWSRSVLLPVESERRDADPAMDRGLATALAALSELQRVCVVMVHVYDWTYRDTADATGISLAAVRNHVHRGLRRLRRELEEE